MYIFQIITYYYRVYRRLIPKKMFNYLRVSYNKRTFAPNK